MRNPMMEILKTRGNAAPLPWKRLLQLARPIRRGLLAMVGLSVSGVLVGLVPPLALGTLTSALIERNDRGEAALLAGLIGLAIVVETAANILSDGMFSRNAGRLYRGLRIQMFNGARARRQASAEDHGGLASRFVSDAETLGPAVAVLDSGSMLLVEFASAIVLLGILSPWTIPFVAPELLITWMVTRRAQRPAAFAGQRRQEELEQMTKTIAEELPLRDDPHSESRFHCVVDRVFTADMRVGWLRAINLQGSGGLAKLGPIVALVVTAFTSAHQIGTLISVYLLAQRVFWGFDGLVDLSLGMQSVRGAIARCFALIDGSTRVDDSSATAWSSV